MTYGDKIRNMSDEELAELINKVKMCGGLIRTEESSIECHGCKDGFCCNVKEWLQSEVEKSMGYVRAIEEKEIEEQCRNCLYFGYDGVECRNENNNGNPMLLINGGRACAWYSSDKHGFRRA